MADPELNLVVLKTSQLDHGPTGSKLPLRGMRMAVQGMSQRNFSLAEGLNVS
jgi:hypothetical protein